MENRDVYLIEVKTVTKGKADVDATAKSVKKLSDESKKAAELAKQQAAAEKAAAKAADETRKATQQSLKQWDFAARQVDQFTGGAVSGFTQIQKEIRGTFPALQGMKGAIAATGIGLLVVAAGLLAQHWESISGWLNSASDETQNLLNDSNNLVAAAESQLDAIGATENILKLQGHTERDILKMRMQATDEAIAAKEMQLAALKQTKTEQTAIAERNHNITKGLLMMLSAPVTLLLGTIDQISAGLQALGVIDTKLNLVDDVFGGIASMIFDPEEVAAEGQAAVDEADKALTDLKNQRAGYQLQLTAMDKQAADARAEKRAADAAAQKERDDKEAAEAAARAKAKADAILAIEDALWDQQATDIEREVRAIEDKYNELEAMAVANGLSTIEIEAARMDAIAALEKKYADEAEKRRQEERDKKKADDEADAAAMVKRRQDTISKINELSQAGAEFVLSLMSMTQAADERTAKKRFQIAKKIQLGAAIMSTAQAIIAALAAPPVGLGFPAGLPGAAMAAMTGTTSIASIASQKFESGAATPPPAPSLSTATASNSASPQIDLSWMGQGSVMNQPVRAYVLEQNVTTSQQSNQLILEQSKL
jgi:hypothetical protein